MQFIKLQHNQNQSIIFTWCLIGCLKKQQQQQKIVFKLENQEITSINIPSLKQPRNEFNKIIGRGQRSATI